MIDKALEIAIQITTKLIKGEEVSNNVNQNLYEAYITDSDVYEYVGQLMEGFELELIDDYGDGLYVSCGITNKTFGYSNEELRKRLKINNNSELYVIYFLMYGLILQFYSDSSTPTYKTYIKRMEIVNETDILLKNIIADINTITEDEIKINSFKNIALIWDNMPILPNNEWEDTNKARAGSSSKAAYVKKLMQYLKEDNLFIEDNDMFYPTNRFHALAQNYFQRKGSEIYQLLNNEYRRSIDA